MKRYYKLNDAIESPTKSNRAFILANEIRNLRGIGRYYVVFDSFGDFLKERDKYPHCHEILVDHKQALPNKGGRLVFDFDISLDYTLPSDFKQQVQSIIEIVVIKHMSYVDQNKFVYVWSTSPNTTKVSKHLTVKNCYFEDWRSMSIIFYRHFLSEWKKKYDWIGNDLIDEQITRNRGSLRMVGSSKIGGNVLSMDNDEHRLVDSLIRIYQRRELKYEQIIKKNQIRFVSDDKDEDECVVMNFYEPKKSTHTKPINCKQTITYESYDLHLTHGDQVNPETNVKMYAIALYVLNSFKYAKNVFEKRNINGDVILLNRLMSAKCLMSGKYHDNEHACLILLFDDLSITYTVLFKCFRVCAEKKTIKLATWKPFPPHDIEYYYSD